MAVTVIFEMKEKQGHRDRLVEGLREMFPVTRQYDGCISIYAYANGDGPGIVCVEEWETKAHYEAYIAWRVERGDIDGVMEICSEPPSVRFFDKLQV